MEDQVKGGDGGKPVQSRVDFAADKHDSTAAMAEIDTALARRAVWQVVLILVAGFLIVGAIGLVPLMLVRLSTRIVADLVVERLVFATGHDATRVVITDQPTDFAALTLEKFSMISFRPARLESVTGTKGFRSIRRLPVEPGAEVAIHGGGDPTASVSIVAPDGGRKRAGSLESLSARSPAVIAIATTHGTPATLTIHVAGQVQAPSILPSGPFELAARQTTLSGTGSKARQDEVHMRAVLPEISPYIETHGSAEGLLLTVTPAGPEPVRLLGKTATAIDKIELVVQNSRGDLETSLAGNCTISFPDYPEKGRVALSEHDALSLEKLAGMSISALAFNPQQGLLHVTFEGAAGKIRSKSGTVSTDHRATLLDRIRHNGYLKALYAMVIALLTALVSVMHVGEILHKPRH